MKRVESFSKNAVEASRHGNLEQVAVNASFAEGVDLRCWSRAQIMIDDLQGCSMGQVGLRIDPNGG